MSKLENCFPPFAQEVLTFFLDPVCIFSLDHPVYLDGTSSPFCVRGFPDLLNSPALPGVEPVIKQNSLNSLVETKERTSSSFWKNTEKAIISSATKNNVAILKDQTYTFELQFRTKKIQPGAALLNLHNLNLSNFFFVCFFLWFTEIFRTKPIGWSNFEHSILQKL